VVSVTVLAFFVLIGFVFWLASLHDRPDFGSEAVRHGAGHSTLRDPQGSLEPGRGATGSAPALALEAGEGRHTS
jgi:hypothetical protein